MSFCLSVLLSLCLSVFLSYWLSVIVSFCLSLSKFIFSSLEVVQVFLESFCSILGNGEQKVDGWMGWDWMIIIQGVFFNWPPLEFAKCWPVSN